jgi:hypothetical protein
MGLANASAETVAEYCGLGAKCNQSAPEEYSKSERIRCAIHVVIGCRPNSNTSVSTIKACGIAAALLLE